MHNICVGGHALSHCTMVFFFFIDVIVAKTSLPKTLQNNIEALNAMMKGMEQLTTFMDNIDLVSGNYAQLTQAQTQMYAKLLDIIPHIKSTDNVIYSIFIRYPCINRKLSSDAECVA